MAPTKRKEDRLAQDMMSGESIRTEFIRTSDRLMREQKSLMKKLAKL